MSYLALYRKYRPVDFDNVYGQDEVVTVIKNAIINNKVSHAYLFCGPRGTGKTTIAKIKSYNLVHNINIATITPIIAPKYLDKNSLKPSIFYHPILYFF